MTDLTSLLATLDSHETLPGAVALRERGYELLRLARGDSVLDVGCGAGRAVHELAERGATATGVDVSEQMLTAARERWSDVDFRLAPAEELPFPDDALDGYRADKVLHALDDPARAVAEARRVLRPGGRAVLVGQDWDFIAIDADDHDLTRRLIRERAAAVPSPNIARGYANLLRDNGFTDVTLEVHAPALPVEAVLHSFAGIAGRSAGAREWLAEQRARAAAGRLSATLPMFLAAGTR